MTYQPISCDFHSELELLTMRRKESAIIFLNKEGVEETIFSKIEDLVTRKKEEFLVLPSGMEIRLDKLISVDGKILAHYSNNCLL